MMEYHRDKISQFIAIREGKKGLKYRPDFMNQALAIIEKMGDCHPYALFDALADAAEAHEAELKNAPQ